jgi:hypothetical protein
MPNLRAIVVDGDRDIVVDAYSGDIRDCTIDGKFR